MVSTLIPLKDLVPRNHDAAECRRVLRDSGKFVPVDGRWLFRKGEARRVAHFLETKLH